MNRKDKIKLIYSIDINNFKPYGKGSVFINGTNSEFINRSDENYFIIFAKDNDNCSYICRIDPKLIKITSNRNHTNTEISIGDLMNNNADCSCDFSIKLEEASSLEDILSSIDKFKNDNPYNLFDRYSFNSKTFEKKYDHISKIFTNKIRNQKNNIHCNEYIFENGKVIVYFAGSKLYQRRQYIVRINYKNNWYVIKGSKSPDSYCMYYFNERDNSNNPFQFKFGDKVKFFNPEESFSLLFKNDSFDRIMKKIELESVFGN